MWQPAYQISTELYLNLYGCQTQAVECLLADLSGTTYMFTMKIIQKLSTEFYLSVSYNDYS